MHAGSADLCLACTASAARLQALVAPGLHGDAGAARHVALPAFGADPTQPAVPVRTAFPVQLGTEVWAVRVPAVGLPFGTAHHVATNVAPGFREGIPSAEPVLLGTAFAVQDPVAPVEGRLRDGVAPRVIGLERVPAPGMRGLLQAGADDVLGDLLAAEGGSGLEVA